MKIVIEIETKEQMNGEILFELINSKISGHDCYRMSNLNVDEDYRINDNIVAFRPE